MHQIGQFFYVDFNIVRLRFSQSKNVKIVQEREKVVSLYDIYMFIYG